MRRINFHSLVLFTHILLLFITVAGSMYVIAINQSIWLIAFLTVPLINIILIPITRRDEKFDPSHPIFLICMALVLGTVLRSFFILSPLQTDAKFLMLLGKPPTVLLKGILAIYVGLIFFVFGYIYPAKPLADWSKRKLFSNPINIKKLVPVAMIITAISLVSALLYYQKMGIDFSDVDDISHKRHYQVDGGTFSSLGYYRLFMYLIEPLYYIFLMYIIQKKKPVFSFVGMFTFLLGFLNLAYLFVQSSRTEAGYVLINTALVIYYLKGRIKWRQVFVVAATASVILVIMSALREAHIASRAETTESNPLVIMVGSLNFLGVDKTSQIIDGMPEKLNFQFGKSLILWLVAPIPRTMWPQKPDITEGREIGQYIYGKRDENSPGGGVPPGYIAEMYLNFGYMGIVAGMFLLGLALKLFYEAFKKVRGTSVFGMVIYILVFIPFASKLIGGDFSGSIVQVISSVVPALLITRFIQSSPVNVT